MNKRWVDSLYEIIATFGCVGFFPWGPGTAASLITILLVWMSQAFLGASTIFLLILFAKLFFLGWHISGSVAARYQIKDPSCIVIDEVVAMGLLSAMVGPDVISSVIVFALFRFFDIVKPFPINLLDEKCTGGFGIMIDDIGAALATALVFKVLMETLLIKC